MQTRIAARETLKQVFKQALRGAVGRFIIDL